MPIILINVSIIKLYINHLVLQFRDSILFFLVEQEFPFNNH